MKRLTTAIVIILCLGQPLQAEIYDPFVLQLREQGYSNITVGRTWLGRIVINANRADIAREIVLNARTGEILGDQASAAGVPDQPRYSRTDDSDDTATSSGVAGVASDDPLAVTVTDAPVERAILDTGTKAAGRD